MVKIEKSLVRERIIYKNDIRINGGGMVKEEEIEKLIAPKSSRKQQKRVFVVDGWRFLECKKEG